jgi:sugar phosphate isomerase/epimerase
MQLVMFSKHLGPLSIPQAGETVKRLGLSGLDLTVRPGGHVLPENVRTGLPEAVRQLKDLGLGIPMITTGITGAEEPHAEAIMAAAASLGIRNLKLGYWPYKPFGQLRAQLDTARKAMDGLESAARKHDVRVSLHVHSGNYLTAEAGNIHLILKDRDPHHVGAYLDPGHMTLEGGAGGWMQGIDLLQDFISMVAVKSFGAFSERDAATGEVKWEHKIVPLKEGMVHWKEVFGCLKQLGWDGIVTFHSEYQGKGSFRDLTVDEVIEQTREDLAYLRPIIKAAGYSV